MYSKICTRWHALHSSNLQNPLASMGKIKACIDQGEWVAGHNDVLEPPVNHVRAERAILLSSCPKRKKKKNSAPASAEKGLESNGNVFIHRPPFCSSQGIKMTLRWCRTQCLNPNYFSFPWHILAFSAWCGLAWKIWLKVSRETEKASCTSACSAAWLLSSHKLFQTGGNITSHGSICQQRQQSGTK